MQDTEDELLLDPFQRFLEEQCSLAALRKAARLPAKGAGKSRAAVFETADPTADPAGDDSDAVPVNLPTDSAIAPTDREVYSQLWTQLCEQGWPLLLVPESQDGIGLSMTQATRVMELAGMALLPLPLGYWINTVAFLNQADANAEVTQRVQTLLSEGQLAGFALESSLGHSFVPYSLNGAPLLKLSYSEGKLRAQWHTGTGVVPGDGIDPMIDSAWLVDQTNQEKTVLSCSPEEWNGYESRGRLLIAAELLGGAARALQLATAYAQERQQFGRSVGGFQGIKHRLAQDWMNLDNARLLIAEAAAVAGEDSALSLVLAETVTQQAADTVVRNALQVHGAMGMTWECDVHFYLKRVHFLNAMLNRERSAADRLQQIWQLSEARMAQY